MNEDLSDRLWNSEIETEYNDNGKFKDHILEQYKLYVEMADRIGARRATANAFFLTLNTLIITAISVCFNKFTEISVILLFIAAIVLCFIWMRLVNSYCQLNSAKYKVVGELEKKLPSSPYWSAEWKALGEGKDTRKYRPLTDVEKWVPKIFMFLYFLLTIIVVIEQ